MSPAAKKPRSRQRRDKAPVQTGIERLRHLVAARKVPDVETTFMDIAEQVAERREAWDLSQAELAELCGTTQSAIARIERGKRPPRIDTLIRVANALDCDINVELLPRKQAKR